MVSLSELARARPPTWPKLASQQYAPPSPAGERVRWVFTEDAEYVPICLPGFSAANCYREEGADAKPPAHDRHEKIYHLVQQHIWEDCKKNNAVYYPPTYEQDGFTHATADPQFLMGVANHFYKCSASRSSTHSDRYHQEVKADWLCLEMTRQTLAAANVTLKFESPSPVGTTAALDPKQSGGEWFPHIYGGIPSAGVVLAEYKVRLYTTLF
eukprot:scaffold1522_cov340-Prasinococcus_capsulatus_cf.AAC.4